MVAKAAVEAAKKSGTGAASSAATKQTAKASSETKSRKQVVGEEAVKYSNSKSGKKSVVGKTVSGAATGAATGAALGSVVPVVGTAAGAVVGGAVGGVGGGVKAHKENKAARTGGWSPHRVLIMEFVICMIILALYPIQGDKNELKPGAWMKKGSAMCGLFLILGLIGSGGRGAAKVSAAFGGIVTLTLLVNERSVFTTLAKKFNSANDDSDPAPDDSETEGDFGSGIAEGANDVGELLNVIKQNQQRVYHFGR